MVQTINDLGNISGKRVLLRVDFNVPQNKQTGEITDDSRIQAALPTIRALSAKGAKTIMVSHLGRPDGKIVESMRLDPVARRLAELLAKPVLKLDEAIGPKVKASLAGLKDGEFALLENIRFYPGEESNDSDFAKDLASLADLYVNDAFGTAHRAHASTAGVASYLSPAVAGLLMDREVQMLGSKLNEPERPFTAIVGGAKIGSKIKVLKDLVKKVDTLIIGGGMAYTFIKAQGGSIGQSICEDDQLETAREIIALADQFDTAIILPTDSVVTPAFDAKGNKIDIFDAYKKTDKIPTHSIPINAIPDDQQGADIGPETAKNFAKLISQSKTILWNGPVGIFEYDSFDGGTRQVAQALVTLTKSGGTTIVGGGDSVSAIEKFNIPKDSLTHVSTGGGASLEFLEGKVLPGLACLDGYQASTNTAETTDTQDFKTTLEDQLEKA